MMNLLSLIYVVNLLLVCGSLAREDVDSDRYYRIENIALPGNVPPEVGAVKLDSEGTIYVALRRGDILSAKPVADGNNFQWVLFATGFHNPCGMEVISPGHVVVSQMAELTDVKDTDGDGKADVFTNLADQWGVSGNYHETNEICADGEGGYYIALGTASYNGPTFLNVRGEYSMIGRRGRNFSPVKWKGWVMHYSKDGKLTPFAKGFRMHNGIMRDKDGNIWAGDNQGDWRATTPLYHVERGNFYGHPSSLVWDSEWPEGKDPLKMPLKEIDAMRTRAAVLLPHEEFNRSASEPVQVPAEFGPFEGQLLLLDNNSTRISRIMLEKVQGKFQGACTHFINDKRLRTGGNRAVFSADGKSLYVGHTIRGWGKYGDGLTRITYRENKPFDVGAINLTEKGFNLKFTLKVDAGSFSKGDFSVVSYTYEDKWSYGGLKIGEREEPLTSVKLDANGVLSLELDKLEAGRVYQVNISKTSLLASESGELIYNRVFCYTLNQLLR